LGDVFALPENMAPRRRRAIEGAELERRARALAELKRANVLVDSFHRVRAVRLAAEPPPPRARGDARPPAATRAALVRHRAPVDAADWNDGVVRTLRHADRALGGKWVSVAGGASPRAPQPNPLRRCVQRGPRAVYAVRGLTTLATTVVARQRPAAAAARVVAADGDAASSTVPLLSLTFGARAAPARARASSAPHAASGGLSTSTPGRGGPDGTEGTAPDAAQRRPRSSSSSAAAGERPPAAAAAAAAAVRGTTARERSAEDAPWLRRSRSRPKRTPAFAAYSDVA